jgi:hypothetical protein
MSNTEYQIGNNLKINKYLTLKQIFFRVRDEKVGLTAEMHKILKEAYSSNLIIFKINDLSVPTVNKPLRARLKPINGSFVNAGFWYSASVFLSLDTPEPNEDYLLIITPNEKK